MSYEPPPSRRFPSLAIGFATIDRPFVVQRLILSIRALFPDTAIYVADQSLPTGPMLDFYASRHVEVLWMNYDCGVTVARNAIVDRCAEDYLVICDDALAPGVRDVLLELLDGASAARRAA